MPGLGAALTGTTLTPVYTGNNVAMQVNGATIGVMQTVTISRAIGRRAVYQIGTPLFADAPVTAVAVTINITSMVLIPSATVQSLAQKGILPSGSLVDTLTTGSFSVTLVDAQGNTVCTAPVCFYNGDTFDITANEPITINISLLAQDATLYV